MEPIKPEPFEQFKKAIEKYKQKAPVKVNVNKKNITLGEAKKIVEKVLHKKSFFKKLTMEEKQKMKKVIKLNKDKQKRIDNEIKNYMKNNLKVEKAKKLQRYDKSPSELLKEIYKRKMDIMRNVEKLKKEK
jgi:hypothetical protein